MLIGYIWLIPCVHKYVLVMRMYIFSHAFFRFIRFLFHCFAFWISSECVFVCWCVCVCDIVLYYARYEKHHIDLYCLFFHCKHSFFSLSLSLFMNPYEFTKNIYIYLYTRVSDWVGSTVEWYCFEFRAFCFLYFLWFYEFDRLSLWLIESVTAYAYAYTVWERSKCNSFSHTNAFIRVVFIVRQCIVLIWMNSNKAARAKTESKQRACESDEHTHTHTRIAELRLKHGCSHVDYVENLKHIANISNQWYAEMRWSYED